MTRLALTQAQADALQPILEQAAAPLSPHVVLCQIRRLDWSEGAHLVMECQTVPRGTAEKMRKLLQTENQQQKAK